MQCQQRLFGSDKVMAVSMPCNSVIRDLEDAKLVSNKFNVKQITVDLSSGFETLKKDINSNLEDNELSTEALINMKPRLRMMTLYSIAQTLGYLVIGTGNLSESMVRIYNKMGR